VYDSIRLIFSIADLQVSEDNLESHEDDVGSEDTEAPYPLRCSFTITKVCNFHAAAAAATFEPHRSLLFLAR
jgi:hypothetical protein